MTIGLTAAPDSLDPAMALTFPAVESMWLVYTPLLTYRHADGRAGTELVPGLARALPRVSADGRTYRLWLRPGLRYSDGTPVRASDFEHTVKRLLILDSPGSPFFTGIVGAAEFAAANDPEGDIEGIDADDASGEITIRLTAPDGTFANVLATDFAGLVPGDSPFEVMDRAPLPGVGAYVMKADGPGRLELDRNEEFDVPGLPEAEIGRIEIRVQQNLSSQAEDVSSGRLDFMQDPPPPDQLRSIRAEDGDRFREYPTASTTYLFLNQRLAPFDSPAARRAVSFAVSPAAIERIYGGLLEPGCTFLPRQIPGYEPRRRCPFGDPDGPGDVARARRLVAAAGLRGADVAIWGPSEGVQRDAAIYVAEVLNRIGFDAVPKLVGFSVYYQLIGNQRTGAQAGIVEFSQDFPHPADFLGPFDGNAIAPTGNLDLGNVDDPILNREIEALRRRSDLDAVAPRWAAVDRRLVDDADVVVLGHSKRTTFLSERMDFARCSVVSPVYQHDYSRFCFK